MLEDTGAVVTWDDRIPDPDNPKRLRQIDISIRRSDSLTIAECRLHADPQDVKWIEELIGRRISLEADGVIAVSSSGFTEGAKKKADRYGIVLRTLSEITSAEVQTWGTQVRVEIAYVHFSGITLYVVASESVIVPTGAHSLRTDKFTDFPLANVLRSLAGSIDVAGPEGPVGARLSANGILLGNLPIAELFVYAQWKLHKRSLPVPVVYKYESGNRSLKATVFRSAHNTTELVHGETTGSMVIDVSGAPLENCCFFRHIDVDHGEPRALSSVAVVGLDNRQADVCSFTVEVIRRSGSTYKQLARGARSKSG